MLTLSQQRCFNHATREAAARCLECQRYFCRECVTEHEDRLICAACLKKLAAITEERRRWWAAAVPVCEVLGGIVVAWLFFYSLGSMLLRVPSDFHDGTVWKDISLIEQ